MNLVYKITIYLQWIPEITHHCPGIPFLIVGTQVDIRDDEATINKLAEDNKRPISTAAGKELQAEFGAVDYVECSALTQV